MIILMAASEATPFAKTGGLADVLGQLPKELMRKYHVEVNLVLPYYQSIKDNRNNEADVVCSFYMPFHRGKAYVGLLKGRDTVNGATVFFIDNNDYFYRPQLYGYYDDGERFAFFSKAITECLMKGYLSADVIHCHDWQTSLIPFLLHNAYEGKLSQLPTVLTIHNLDYQGWAGEDFTDVVLHMEHLMYPQTQIYNQTNFLLTGINEADRITTVSENYAKEILEYEIGGTLTDALRDNKGKLKGILNGFDFDADDLAKGSIKKKNKAKTVLGNRIGFKVTKETVLLGMVSRFAEHKGIGILCDALPLILQDQRVRIVICGKGEPDYEEKIHALSEQNPQRVYTHIMFDNEFAELIYKACDIYLMPSLKEPCGLSQLIAMKHGALPVVHRVGGLKDTVRPICEKRIPENSGYGFLFDDPLDFEKTLTTAVHMYYDDARKWRSLSEYNSGRNFGWTLSAKKYYDLYLELLNENSL